MHVDPYDEPKNTSLGNHLTDCHNLLSFEHTDGAQFESGRMGRLLAPAQAGFVSRTALEEGAVEGAGAPSGSLSVQPSLGEQGLPSQVAS